MGKQVLLYEQIYNDLTAAVAKAKQACRKQKSKPLKIAAPDKKQRGRPKGSKDTLPRKARANVQTVNVRSGSSDCVIESMACSDSWQISYSRFSQSEPCEAAAYFQTQSEIKMLPLSDPQTDIPQDPPCWELPLPY